MCYIHITCNLKQHTLHIYIYIYIYVCVCIIRKRKEKNPIPLPPSDGHPRNHLITHSPPPPLAAGRRRATLIIIELFYLYTHAHAHTQLYVGTLYLRIVNDKAISTIYIRTHTYTERHTDRHRITWRGLLTGGTLAATDRHVSSGGPS